MIFKNLKKYTLWLLVFFQFISVACMSTGIWPTWVVFVNIGLSAAYIFFAPTFEGLLLVIASAPFYIAIPNKYFDSFASWRILVAWLFVTWVAREFYGQYVLHAKLGFFHRVRIAAYSFVKMSVSKTFVWDTYLWIFGGLVLASTLIARYKVQTLKQAVYLLNAYALYLVVIAVIKSKAHILKVVETTAVSLGIIVLIGYFQLFLTFFIKQYYFWQYWATMVSRIYYGATLSNTLVYSNSWFAYSSGSIDLRMFSIMPDSHSFAMVAVLCFVFLLALTYFQKNSQAKNFLLWTGIALSALAIIFSGTRGVWVGMLAPVVVAGWLFIKRFNRPGMKKILFSFGLIIFLFLISPALTVALRAAHHSASGESFLSRASSIYNFGEESNAGRILMWKHSLAFFIHHPLGVGYGNFLVSINPNLPTSLSYADLAKVKNNQYNLPEQYVTAHSLYLNLLVELGVLGIAAFGVFVLSYCWTVWKFFMKHRYDNNFYTFFVASIFLTFVWFLAYAFFDVTIFNDKVLLFCLISLALSGIIMRDIDKIDIIDEI